MESETQLELMGECAVENGLTAHLVAKSEEEEQCGDVNDVCKLRNLFEHVLIMFLDVCCNDKPRPLPVRLGDGGRMDLFRLLLSVRKLGGYYIVSKNSCWNVVAEECGLHGKMNAVVKLVHVKYLREFDRSLQGDFYKKDLVSEELKTLLKELEFDLQGFMSTEEYPTEKNVHIEDQLKEDGAAAAAVGEVNETALNEVSCKKGEGADSHKKKGEGADSHKKKGEGADLHKKKGEAQSFSRMLNWLLMVAKMPSDPSIGIIPPPSMWKDCRNDELWHQALSAKEALTIKRDIRPNIEQTLLQKKLRSHPSMYDESAGHSHSNRLREKLKFNGRLPSFKKCRFYPDCISCKCPQDKELENPSKLVTYNKEEAENPKAVTSRKRKVRAIKDEKDLGDSDDIFSDDFNRKEVNVGPLFQAEIPEWTGIVPESDSKYLGITVWVPEKEEDSLNSIVPIDKGRDDSCSCLHPGSVPCTRFHIADKRFKLKLEIGSMFYEWGFDRIGEDISLSWTNKQEKRFKALIGLRNTAQKNALWKNTLKFFPNKTRENLVSYYFNVFTLRRRRYQNRMTPQDIDSSDDEKDEIGGIDDHYGLNTLEFSPVDNLPFCIENREFFDF